MNEIIVIGGGGHAKVVISLLNKIGGYKVLGYLDSHDNGPLLGVQYLGSDTLLKGIKNKNKECLAAIGIGSVNLTDKREKIFNQLQALSYSCPSIISPSAIVNEDVIVGEGSVIADGVVINTGSRIGKCSIINTTSSIDHDCQIGDFVHIAPGVILSGGVTIGSRCFMSVGSTVIQYKTITENCLIGAGATVIEDCLEQGVYFGTPARKKAHEKVTIK